PEALINYLARLGWAHGDDEIFSREQFVSWFELDAINKAPARFDPEKLRWLNQQYVKALPPPAYAQLVAQRMEAAYPNYQLPPQGFALFRDRVAPDEFVEATKYLHTRPVPSRELVLKHYSESAGAALAELLEQFASIPWQRQTIHVTIKAVAQKRNLKLGQVAMPLRIMMTGVTETPSIDAVLEIIGRNEVIARLKNELDKISS
ncbi:MAG: glutamate--tRNA ligase, partial [Burkholderiales bacterium]